MSKSEPLVSMTVRIPEELRYEVGIIAKQQKTSIKEIVRQLLENFIEEQKNEKH